MSGRVVGGASVTIPFSVATLDVDGHINDPRASASIRSAIEVIADAARERRAS